MFDVTYDYDLIVLGGGAAGFSASIEARKRGKEVLLINDGGNLNLGGTCVNVGCIPSKTLIELGRRRFYSRESIEFDYALEKTKEIVEKLREKNYENVLKEWGINFIDGRGMLVDKHTVRVNGKEVNARHILIATGSVPNVPHIEGLEDSNYLTYRTVLNLKEKPSSIAILGGGAVASEYAQVFNYFGIKTKVINRSERILRKFEEKSSTLLMDRMRREGIEIYTNTKVYRVEDGVLFCNRNGRNMKIEAELIMVATGIKGMVDGLGLETVGVKVKEGFVDVDQFLRTSVDNIYAAGDVTGLMPLETVAAKQGKVAVVNMLGGNSIISYEEIPYAVFTFPEVARVGRREGYSRELMLDAVERGVIKEGEGYIKMYVNENIVKGIEIVSENASELIDIASLVVKNKMSLKDIREATFVFPTLSEMIKKVAQSFEEDLSKMPCCFE